MKPKLTNDERRRLTIELGKAMQAVEAAVAETGDDEARIVIAVLGPKTKHYVVNAPPDETTHNSAADVLHEMAMRMRQWKAGSAEDVINAASPKEPLS